MYLTFVLLGPRLLLRCAQEDMKSPKKGRELQTLRVESRKGGATKIKTKYLEDYNLLESTFMTASILILLSGIMFKSSESAPGCVAGRSTGFGGLPVLVPAWVSRVCMYSLF
jgi:hypothetical protein